MPSLALIRRRVRRALLARRRLLAALCAALAVAASLRVVAGPPAATTTVLTAARDLPSGAVLSRADLRPADFRPETVPDGVLAEPDLLGRTTAAPLRAGEPLTDARVVQPSLLAGYPGSVAVPVRVSDAGVVGLLRVGDRVDVVATDPNGAEAVVVAPAAPVVAIPEAGDDVADVSSGALVVLALSEKSALTVAKSSVSSFISLVVRR